MSTKNNSQYIANPCSSSSNASSSAKAPLATALDVPSIMTVPCIFCDDEVSQNELNPDVHHTANQEFRKMLKALYFNFELSPNEVPQDCTERTFPFCKLCRKDVRKIYQEQFAIDEAEKRMGMFLANMEKNVAEMELLKPKSIENTLEESESVKLTGKILEGIRAKLLMQKKLRQSGKPYKQEREVGEILSLPSFNTAVQEESIPTSIHLRF